MLAASEHSERRHRSSQQVTRQEPASPNSQSSRWNWSILLVVTLVVLYVESFQFPDLSSWRRSSIGRLNRAATVSKCSRCCNLRRSSLLLVQFVFDSHLDSKPTCC